MIEEIQKQCPNFRGICPDPVFIIGSPRSGTTALAHALGQHSQLWMSAESDFLFYLFANQHAQRAYQQAFNVPKNRWLKVGQVARNEFLAYLGLGMNALFTSRSGGRRWIDQTPLYTIIAEALSELFPGAYFVHILRDGRKVVNSMTNFLQSHGIKATGLGADFVGSWTTDFRAACRVWNQYTEAAMQFQMQHPDRCFTVYNERLLEKPDVGFRAIFDFIGAPYEDGPPSHFSTNRINSSFQQNSVERLSPDKFPNPWKSWTVEQRMIFLGEAGATMLKYDLASECDLWLFDPAYKELVANIRAVVETILPLECTVAVVSKGDSELLNLHGRRAWHLPCGDDGVYTGHHPADSQEAIEHLESLRSRGADYLLVPNTAFWWLDHYSEFRTQLESHYRCIFSDESCRIYSLCKSHGQSQVTSASQTSRDDDPLTPTG